MLLVSMRGIAKWQILAVLLSALFVSGCENSDTSIQPQSENNEEENPPFDLVNPNVAPGGVCISVADYVRVDNALGYSSRHKAYGAPGHPEFALFEGAYEQGPTLSLIHEGDRTLEELWSFDAPEFYGPWYLVEGPADMRIVIRCDPNAVYNECSNNRHREFIIDGQDGLVAVSQPVFSNSSQSELESLNVAEPVCEDELQ